LRGESISWNGFTLLLFVWGLLGQGSDLAVAVSLGGVATLPIALIAARPAFARMAPDLLWRADQNAATRHAMRGSTPAE
jgi:hypothetical protein